ncbi:MAG: class I SAM-dependent methyltransferase [Bacteroidota bacterium]
MTTDQLQDVIQARVERERAAHTEDDVLGRSIVLKNRFAHIWNYPALRRLRASQDTHLADLTGRRVLDFGCGRGERSLTLLERNAVVDGIDISRVYIEEADAAAHAAGHSAERFQFVVGDAHALPYADATFDIVVGDGILHHLDLDTALSEIHRVLKPGGRALFSEPLLDNPLLKLFRLLTPRARTEDERPFSASDLRRIDDSGLWNVESSYCGLVSAPVAVMTSFILRPYPDNVLLRMSDSLEKALGSFGPVRSMNQYVFMNLVRSH